MGGTFGAFYRISTWVMKCAAVNLLWFSCNLLVFFAAIYWWKYANGHADLLVWLSLVLVPLFLFPSSSALMGVIRKWILEEEEPLLLSFFRYYKENFKNSAAGGFIFTAVWVGWGSQFLSFSNEGFTLFSLLISSFIWTWMMYFLSYQVHFQASVLQTLKNTLIIAAIRPLATGTVMVCSLIVLYVSIHFTFFLPFFSTAIIGYVSFGFFYRVVQQAFTSSQQVSERIF